MQEFVQFLNVIKIIEGRLLKQFGLLKKMGMNKIMKIIVEQNAVGRRTKGKQGTVHGVKRRKANISQKKMQRTE